MHVLKVQKDCNTNTFLVCGGSMLVFCHTPEFCSNAWMVQQRNRVQPGQRDHCLPVHNSDPNVVPGLLQLFPLHATPSLGDDCNIWLHLLHDSRKPSGKTGQHCPKQVRGLPEERETTGRISVPGLGSLRPLMAPSPLDELCCLFCGAQGCTKQSFLHWHFAFSCKLCHKPSSVCLQNTEDQGSVCEDLETVYCMLGTHFMISDKPHHSGCCDNLVKI